MCAPEYRDTNISSADPNASENITGIHVAPKNQNKSESITGSSDAMQGYNAEVGISIQITNANVPNKKSMFLTLFNTIANTCLDRQMTHNDSKSHSLKAVFATTHAGAES
jgi:hypothetical protein